MKSALRARLPSVTDRPNTRCCTPQGDEWLVEEADLAVEDQRAGWSAGKGSRDLDEALGVVQPRRLTSGLGVRPYRPQCASRTGQGPRRRAPGAANSFGQTTTHLPSWTCLILNR